VSEATQRERGARAGEGRRPPGERGSTEPLAASWRPTHDRPKRNRHKGVRGAIATYGWRVYALPILLAVTVLVAVQTAGETSQANSAMGIDKVRAEPTDGPTTPDAQERPQVPVDVNIPSAELPNGGQYTQAGAGRWHGVPGDGPKVGTGAKFFTYTVEVEDGIDAAAFGGDDAFAKLVDQTLADPRSWTGGGQISVQRVAPDFPNPAIRISLTSPDTAHRPDMCGYSITYESSCWRGADKRLMINLARWVRGAVAFGGDMLTYRQYAINHEIGHAFRNGHVGCAQEGALAPVMMQQSFGVANNYVAQLNRAVGLKDAVKEDGLTCKPNAWPNPQAVPPA
jgi:hypothetical protein